MAFQKAGEILAKLIRQKGLAAPLEAAALMAQAERLGAGRWKSQRFKDGVLTLAVSSGPQAEIIRGEAPQIIRALNKALKKSSVQKIRVVLQNA